MARLTTLPVEPNASKPAAPTTLPVEEAAPKSRGIGVIEDVLRSLPAGVREGYEGIGGMGGDLYNLQVAGAEWLGNKMGWSPETMAQIEEAKGQNWMPTSQDVAEKATNPLLGESYQSQTRAGKIARLIAGFVPGMTRNITRSVIAPGVGTAAGGAIGEQLGYEGTGQLLGGLLGGSVPGGTMRSIAGPRMDPRRATQVQTMIDEGIPLTGGQATGRKGLKYVEAGPFEGRSAAIADRQQTAFNRAALRRAGVFADDAGPETMSTARDALGFEYDDLVARNNGVPMDQALQNELLDTTVGYQRLKGTGGPQIVEDYMNRITEAAQANGGVVPADVFQTIRSDISKTLRTATDRETITALRSMQDSMFDSIGRNGQPEIVAEARDLNNRYRNFKVIERAMEGTGEQTQLGDITPNRLATAVARGDKGAMVYGRGDMSDLAKAGKVTMTELPQSGTAARMAPFAVGGAGLALAQQLMQGNLGTAATIGGGIVAPWAASRITSSRPFTQAVINQATGRSGPVLDPITLALLARQREMQERKER